MNMKDKMREDILNHGLQLMEVFGLPENTLPVTLCKALFRIENKLHRLMEDYCNGILQDDEKLEKIEKKALQSVNKLLMNKTIPIIINQDPRGYALKIPDNYMRDNNIRLYRDWGGYGIIAPDFRVN